jgi:hypothetical protein
MAANNNSDPILDEGGGGGVKHEAVGEAGEGKGGGGGAAATQAPAAMLPRSGSRPQLDLSGAAIHGNLEDRNPPILLPNQSDDISHLALDIGGTYVRGGASSHSPRFRLISGWHLPFLVRISSVASSHLAEVVSVECTGDS